MWNRKNLLAGLGVFAVAVAGACVDTPPTEPRAVEGTTASMFGGVVNPAVFPGGTDAEFVRMAEAVPGFGGLFYDEAGELNIYLQPALQTMSTPQALLALRGHVEALGIDPAAQPVRVLEAQYDFIQLQSVRRAISGVMSLAGVVYTDTDEAVNRVAIGVEHARAAAAVEHTLGMLDVPREAIVIRETEPFELLQTLRSRVRPIAGGLQIWRFIPPGQAGVCTLGFNVRSPEVPSVHGFVTNSHCTMNQYGSGPVGTMFNQKEIALPEEHVGVEVYDAPLFTNAQDPRCPAGRQCRYSDAAGVRYLPGVQNAFARIYRTLAPSPLPADTIWTIDPNNPMFHIVAERPANAVVGDVIHKVGRRTGWTHGPVIGTCTDNNIGGSSIPNLTILCSDNVQAFSGPGDSGSPTFRRLGDGANPNVELSGILFAGTGTTFLYSPMQNIRAEAPPPPGRTWRTFPPPSAP